MAELVGLQTQVPDMMTKLSQLLTVRQQQQAIQGQAAQVQQEQQTARQRAALATYDWNRHLGKDGTIDLNTLTDPELQKAAGDQYPELLSRMVTAKSQQLEAKSRLLNLNTDQLNTYRGLIGGLLQDKDVVADNEKGRQKVNDAYVQFGEAYGKDALPVIEAYAKRLQGVPQGRMADAIRALQMQAVDAGNQLEKQRPTYQSRGSESVNVNPYTPEGTAPSIPMGIPPGFHVVVDPRTQNPYLLNEQTGEVRDMGAGYPGKAPGGARGGIAPSAAPTTPTSGAPASMPRPFYPGQPHDIQAQQTEVANTRTAGDQVSQARSINAEILRLSRDTTTGPGTAAWRDSKFGGMFADNYQELGKFLEKNAIASMTAMGGPPSDARLSAAAAANGSTHFNPGALQAVTKFNDATTSALERYRRGMDKAVGTRNSDYSALPDFKAAWAQNFDVDIFRIANAERDSDKEELARLRKEILSKPGRAKDLAEKKRNLEALATTGRLP